MPNLPVHWYEGMFLRPHHLQAADRYWTEAFQASDYWDHHFRYGLRSVQFNDKAFGNHQVELISCEARLPDGTSVSIQNGQGIDRVSLQSAFVKQSTTTVYLAVPKLQLGRANIGGSTGSPEPRRFRETQLEMPDETAGGNEQSIAFRLLNARLLLSTDDLSGYELLPIARVERAGDREAVPRLDPKYIPPLLACDAWSPLQMGILRPIYDIIGKKLEVLSQQVINRGISLDCPEAGDMERLLMLTQLNSAHATLGVLVFAQGVHPFVAYTELCRIVGQIAIFDAAEFQLRAPEVPRYDHDDLGRIFQWAYDQIRRLMELVRDLDYERRFFVGSGLGMQVTLEPKWLNADWKWYVGVDKKEITEKECRDLLSVGILDWKLGSSRQVEILFKHHAEGLQLVPLERPPRALPSTKDWVYYEVTRGNAAWKDVFETQTLALRLKDTLIENRDRLQGVQTMVVSFRAKQIPLEFALFAVPIKK